MADLTCFDVVEQSKALQAKGLVRSAKKEKPKAIAFTDVLKNLPPGMVGEQFRNLAFKAIGSTDIGQLRLVSLAPQVGVLRNDETILLNILESRPTVRATDYQIRIRERKIGFDTVAFFNMDGSLPPGAQSDRPFRYNTLGAAGNLLDIRFMPQELSAQSPVDKTDLVAQEVEDEMVRIRRFMNSTLLSNVEQNNEAPMNIPQPGGVINRSVLYNVATSGNLTNPLIQGRVDAIANFQSAQGIGYKVPLVALCPYTQISAIRDLMIARWPGENSQMYYATQSMLMQRLASVNIPVDQMAVYKPDPGRPVIFIAEGQLPSGTCLFFDPAQLQLAQFEMFGQMGPWVLERPTAQLTTLLLVWNAWSLIDPLVESRAILTGLND